MTDWPCKDKIYYEAPEGVIYCGDCREILPHLPKVDLVLTDPPYAVSEDYDIYQDTTENLQTLLKVVIPELQLHSDLVALTCGVPNVGLYPHPTWMLAYVHPTGTGSTSWGFSSWHPILVYGKDPYLTNRMGRRPDIIVDKTQSPQTEEGRLHNKAKLIHPCVKPLEEWKRIITRTLVKLNGLILDPFLGSGTTAVAAQQLNHKFIGIEISEKYCQIAVERLRQSVMRLE
jgi:hypothetical protein